ncbi:hypothetical protein NBRC116583_19400 [Arenicella sp. 4NH20-0111]|uniref:hemerythrin domain-containing protein n=1 Tax=Arenicella sp. 4NH20-0111 TaxID=3127648 RepID=UPI00310C4208
MFKFVSDKLKFRRSKTCKEHTVPYNGKLIQDFEDEHLTIINLFKQIASVRVDIGFNPLLDTHLSEFKSKFQEHLIIENLELYKYLEQNFDGNSSSEAITNAFKQDMNDVASHISHFCTAYESQEFDAKKLDDFDAAYHEISITLNHRFHLEERELFELYKDTSLEKG